MNTMNNRLTRREFGGVLGVTAGVGAMQSPVSAVTIEDTTGYGGGLYGEVPYGGGSSGGSFEDISDKQVALDGEVIISVSPSDVSNNLAIQGETAGWTVISTTPGGSAVTVSPEPGTVLGSEESITTFESYDDGEFTVTLSPPSDASEDGTYAFTAQELDDDAVINSESFTITTGFSAPGWVDNSSITSAQYNAFDDGDGELTDSEIRDGIQTYIQNSVTGDGQVNGVGFSDDDIRALISGYIQSGLG